MEAVLLDRDADAMGDDSARTGTQRDDAAWSRAVVMSV
jgi:hypothetical protein